MVAELKSRGLEFWGYSLLTIAETLKTKFADAARLEASARALDRF